MSPLLLFGGFGRMSTDPGVIVFGTLSTHYVGLAQAHGTGRVAVWGDFWILWDQEINRNDDAGTTPTVQFWNNLLL